MDRTAIDLPTADEILATLAAHGGELRRLGVRRLGLFGSFRTGVARPDSDIDLLLTLDRPSFSDYMDIKLFLEDLFERRVDLVIESALKPRIRPHIIEEVLYAPGL